MGFFLIDPNAFSQTSLMVVKLAAIYKQLRQSYKNDLLGLLTQHAVLRQMSAIYGLDSENLRGMSDIESRVSDSMRVIEENATDMQTQILEKPVYQPDDPAEITRKFTGILSNEAIETLRAAAKQNQEKLGDLRDTAKSTASYYGQEVERAKVIRDYQKDLTKLGDKSALKTAQLTAIELNTLLQQQEASLSTVLSIQRAQSAQELARVEANAQDFDYEQRRLYQATQQGSGETGPEKWSSLR